MNVHATYLHSVHVRVRDHPVLTPHPVLPMNRQSQILRHHPVHVNNLHARSLQRARKRLQLLVPVQVRAMQQPARPSKDRRDRVRRRLSPLLVLAVVSGDRAVRRFALDGEAVGRDKLRGHHSEGAETLREDVRLHISVVILRCPDEAARGLDHLRHHIVDETVLVIDACRFELFLVFACRSQKGRISIPR